MTGKKGIKVFIFASTLLCHTLLWAETLPSYSFSVVPQQSAKRLAQLWAPVLEHISRETGIKLQFKTAKNIPEFEQRLAEGTYDFAYMNPYHFTVFNRNPGYRAIAVRRDQPIRGILVVRKDNPINSLTELSDKTLAFPSPAAFAASLLPRAQLAKEQINFNTRYVSSHDSVYLGVARGLFPAGGGVKRTLNNTDPAIREQLRILWKTDAYTPHAIAAHPKVDMEITKKIQQALITMGQQPAGQELLNSLKIKNGLISATDADWNDVRDLNLDALQHLN